MCSDKEEKKANIKIFQVYKKFFNDTLLKGFTDCFLVTMLKIILRY